MFIRQQLSSYYIPNPNPRAEQELIPAIRFVGPCPHGRSGFDDEGSVWGPDKYGYTDFDDYHLAIYGA
jgi:hypothetical protein